LRDAGAGNARTLQDIGSRAAIWLDATDATAFKTPKEVFDSMMTNVSPKDHTGVVAVNTSVAPSPPVAPESTEPVTEDGGPAKAPTDSPQACQVNFVPSDTGAILCCWSPASIETSPDVIIERNGKYVEAKDEEKKVEQDLADAENHKNEQCQAMKDAEKAAESAGPGPEAMEANQKASTYASGCKEAEKMVLDLAKQKESWNSRVMAIRGQIEAALGRAREELKESKGGFPCVQASVEIVVPKAAATDPSKATVDVAHTFPRHLAPGNPKLIAGGDSGLVEMQLEKHSKSSLF